MRAILDRDNVEECTTPTCFRSNAAPVRKIAGGRVAADNYMFEAAGVAFFNRFEKKIEASSMKRGKNDHASSDDEHSDDGEEYDTKGTKDKTGGILKLSPLLKDVELYPLMGVQDGASQDDIKKAYRALALSCHPDKMGDVDDTEAKRVQEHFVKIQEAYEILSDPSKRQLYDSSLPFDESIPRFKPGEGDDFFQVFTEAFRRNARFSQRRPVPELGGAETPLSDVKKFYDFWFGFSSWRDPMVMAQADGQDLHDLEDAECREEKRWMIRENQRVGRKYKQTEKDRITKLVTLAEASDPRILAEKEAKKAARAAEAARRQEERLAAERAKEAAEQKRREEEEALQAAEAEKRKKDKAIKDAAKAEVKKFRQRLRTLHSSVKEYVHNEQLSEVCLQLDCAALQKLGDTVEKALKRGDKGKEDAVASFHAAIKSLGLTPMIPKEEDVVSTSSGGPSEEATPAVVEDPAVVAERKRIEDARRKEAEARKKVEDAKRAAEREKLAAIAAEERKKREEQRRKEEQAAETRRKQMEKKEREKAKKEEEKKRKAEEQEVQRREQQREAARQKASEQAAKADEEAQALVQAREIERVVKLFEDDRQERLDVLDPLTDEDLVQHLDSAFQADKTLCGALNLLKKASIEDDQRRDCLMVLLSTIGPVWQLALDPPADVKPQNSIRNKTKKARQRLRDVAHKRFAALADNFGSEHVKTVTPYQKGMVAGQFEWPVWTVVGREEELRVRAELGKAGERILEDVAPVAEQETAEAQSGKKGKKAKDQKKAGGEEDLDSLFAEFGVTVEEKKGKKKKR